MVGETKWGALSDVSAYVHFCSNPLVPTSLRRQLQLGGDLLHHGEKAYRHVYSRVIVVRLSIVEDTFVIIHGSARVQGSLLFGQLQLLVA